MKKVNQTNGEDEQVKSSPTPKKVKKDALLKAIQGSGGIISVIAQKLGVSWDTARHAIEFWEEARAALREETETNLDLAESVILRNIRNAVKMQQDGYTGVDSGDAWRYLRTKGRARGYADDPSVNINNTNAMVGEGAQVHLYIPDNGRETVISFDRPVKPKKGGKK